MDGTDDATTQDPAPLSDRIFRANAAFAPQVSFAPAQRVDRATTPERGLLAETEGRPALTDASGKKRRKLKQSLCFSHNKHHPIFAFTTHPPGGLAARRPRASATPAPRGSSTALFATLTRLAGITIVVLCFALTIQYRRARPRGYGTSPLVLDRRPVPIIEGTRHLVPLPRSSGRFVNLPGRFHAAAAPSFVPWSGV